MTTNHQDLDALVERMRKPCNRCGGTGWLYFRCGTPWRCKCSPMKFENRAKEAGQ